jgi:prophage regulatory protein
MQAEQKLIALPVVSSITSLSKSEIWRRVKTDPKFPKPIRLSLSGPNGRCTRWSLQEVLAWVDARLAERKQAQASQAVAA